MTNYHYYCVHFLAIKVKHPTSKRRLRTSSMSSCSTTSQQSKQLRFGICTVGGGVAGTPKENQDAYFIENSPAIVSIDQFALVEHNVVLQRRSQAQSTSYRFVTPPEIHVNNSTVSDLIFVFSCHTALLLCCV